MPCTSHACPVCKRREEIGEISVAKNKGGGGIDKFRIKIWNKGTVEVVYDNQMDALEDADPTTALGGGSIVIHK